MYGHQHPRWPTIVASACAAAAAAVVIAGCSASVPVPDPEPEPVIRPTMTGEERAYENPYLGGNEALSDYRRVLYTLPSGWEVRDEFIGKNLGTPEQVAISFWTTPGVFPDACHRKGATLTPLELGDHQHGDDGTILAGPTPGLRSQLDRNASEPANVTIAGQLALRMELSVPADIEITSCDDGVYRSWPAYEHSERGNDDHIAGQVDVIYQVDVDRMPLIIDVSYRPGSSDADREQLDAVLQSLRIER